MTDSHETNPMLQLLAEYGDPVQLSAGTIVEGTVICIDAKLGAWINYGGKVDALVPHSELIDKELTPGETTSFYVVDEGEDEELIGGQGAWRGPVFSISRADNWKQMEQQMQDGATVTVTVTRVVRNVSGGVAGLNVQSENGLPGFVPYSMLAPGTRPGDHLLRTDMLVKVVEVDVTRRKLLFSQRAYHAEQAAEAEKRRAIRFAGLKTGDIVRGKIVKAADYGYFVDIGSGLHGLLHNSQIPSDTEVAVGDEFTVTVTVCEMRDGKRQVGLSLKPSAAAAA